MLKFNIANFIEKIAIFIVSFIIGMIPIFISGYVTSLKTDMSFTVDLILNNKEMAYVFVSLLIIIISDLISAKNIVFQVIKMLFILINIIIVIVEVVFYTISICNNVPLTDIYFMNRTFIFIVNILAIISYICLGFEKENIHV